MYQLTLTDYAPLRLQKRIYKSLNTGRVLHHALKSVDGNVERQTLPINDFEGAPKLSNFCRIKTASPQTFHIDRFSFSRAPRHSDESRDVFADRGSHATKAMSANLAKLMDQRVPGQNRPISHNDMPSQSSVIHQDSVAADYAVMPYVYIGHQEITITNLGERSILYRTPMYRHIFADHVVIADM